MAFDDDPEEIRKEFENPRHLSGKYAKHLDTRVELDATEINPDRKRQAGGWAVDSSGRDIRFALSVLRSTDHGRFGAIVLRATGDPKTGKLTFAGMSIFNERQIDDGEL